LRGIEIEASLILKATKVDGVYNKDPSKFDDAVKYDNLTFDQVLDEKLGVMDLTAICLCRDHHVPLQVFDMNKYELMYVSLKALYTTRYFSNDIF